MTKNQVAIGSLYDLNKDLFKKEQSLDIKETFTKNEEEFKKFLKETNNKYYMLLCHEQRDYTLFNRISISEESADEALEGLEDCVRMRGSLLSFSKTDDGLAYEIWIRNKITSEIFVYYFFPYNIGVIECN